MRSSVLVTLRFTDAVLSTNDVPSSDMVMGVSSACTRCAISAKV